MFSEILFDNHELEFRQTEIIMAVYEMILRLRLDSPLLLFYLL